MNSHLSLVETGLRPRAVSASGNAVDNLSSLWEAPPVLDHAVRSGGSGD
jgi:hypothetical protein